MKKNISPVLFLFLLLLYSCQNNNRPSAKDAEKAIRYAFNTFIIAMSNGTQRVSDKDDVKIHDLKGPGEGPVNAIMLGIDTDSARVMQANAEKEGHYVAVATLVQNISYDGKNYFTLDSLGAIFALFKSGDGWDALPVSGLLKLKKR